MNDDFSRLLDATIGHLESLKHQGARFVTVEEKTLRLLSMAPPRAPLNPASSAPPALESHATPPPAPAPSPARVVTETTPALVVESAEKQQAMAELRTRAMACVQCPHLAAARKNVVFGIGDLNAPLLFVGEAPGAEEDEQGEPFVGKAGQLLTRIIKAMGFGRESVYIANVLKCRPDTPGETAGNRKPTTVEMKTCLPYLQAQINIIQPKVIVALGATAVEGLFGKPMPIGKIRGHFQDWRGAPVMPTFHPAYLLRNQSLREKRKVWEDMLQVLEKLQMPISDKQRGFFLKA